MQYRGAHYGGKSRRPLSGRLMAVAVVLTVLVLVLIYLSLAPSFIEVSEKTLRAADLPKGLETLRVVYLTDIHDGAFFNSVKLENLVRQVNMLNADIVVMGGHYRENPASTIRFFESMPRINARYAVCAVLGSTDRPTDGNQMNRLLSAMHNKGVTPLINEVLPLRLGEGTVYIAGTDDVKTGQPNIPGVAAKVRREDYVIYVSHSPTVIPASLNATDANGKSNWYDLGLFGETHGGQIAFAGDLLKLSDVSDRYREGWRTENRIDLLISRGIGMEIVPIRLFCRPQMHLITLVND